MTFGDCGVKMALKMECSFVPDLLQVAPFLDKAPTSGHSGALERSRVQKLMPNGVSGNQTMVQKRVQGGVFDES